MDYTIISKVGENAWSYASVSLQCPMCHGECVKHGTYCDKCDSSGVIWRPGSLPEPRFDEQEALTKAASLVVQALGYVAEGTWPCEVAQGKEVPMMWTIEEAMSCAWGNSQADIGERDINAVLWAIGQCVKGLMVKERVIRRAGEQRAKRTRDTSEARDDAEILIGSAEG